MMSAETDILWHHALALRTVLAREVHASLVATAALDLSVPQSVALFQVAEAGPLTVSALQARIGRGQAATSHLVTQLERRELVQRSVDPEDRRRTLVALAPAGRALLAEIQRARRAAFDAAAARLPSETLRQLTDAFAAACAALDAR